MTLLFRNREAAIAWIRDQLDLTWGNLDGHAKRLEQEGYIERDRVLTSDGFEVRLRLTTDGRESFRSYLGALERFQVEAPDPAEEEDARSSTA